MLKKLRHHIFNIFDSAFLFTLMLIGILALLFATISDASVDYLLLTLHLIIGIISVFFISWGGFGQLAKTLGVFFFISFGIIPILELNTLTVYWGGDELNYISQIKASICVIVFLTSFAIGYILLYRVTNLVTSDYISLEIKLFDQILFVIISVFFLLFVLYLYGWNFLTMFFRGGEYAADMQVELKSSYLIVDFFIRPLIFNIGIFLFFFGGGYKLMSIIGLLVGMYAVFPTGVPRFLAAALYMPFILHWAYSSKWSQEKKRSGLDFFLPNILILGLFIIFPFLDIFRWYTSEGNNSFNIFGLDVILAGHFDGYQMLVRAIDVGNLSLGGGFLGALLFFVPRSIWPDKPIGSAQEIAQLSNLAFDNLSMTLVAELYLNFWYVGICFGALVLGMVLSYFDKIFTRIKGCHLSIGLVFYFQSIGLLLFVLRGSILSAFAYSCAVAFSWVIILWLYRSISIIRALGRR